MGHTARKRSFIRVPKRWSFRGMDDISLTENKCSGRYKVPGLTLQRWRTTGEGPPFVRLATRTFTSRTEELAQQGFVVAADLGSTGQCRELTKRGEHRWRKNGIVECAALDQDLARQSARQGARPAHACGPACRSFTATGTE
jgi:hypothetical protein